MFFSCFSSKKQGVNPIDTADTVRHEGSLRLMRNAPPSQWTQDDYDENLKKLFKKSMKTHFKRPRETSLTQLTWTLDISVPKVVIDLIKDYEKQIIMERCEDCDR